MCQSSWPLSSAPRWVSQRCCCINLTRMHKHRHQHHVAELPQLTEKLRRKSRRVTGPRQAILEILRQHPHPMSNKEIFAALPKGDCDLATVYRSLHLLEGMKMVKRFDLGEG